VRFIIFVKRRNKSSSTTLCYNKSTKPSLPAAQATAVQSILPGEAAASGRRSHLAGEAVAEEEEDIAYSSRSKQSSSLFLVGAVAAFEAAATEEAPAFLQAAVSGC
jgi:hypothetical protein